MLFRSNTNENLSIRKTNKYYAIESRSGINPNDTIQFRLGQIRVTNYRYEFIPQHIDIYNVEAFLEDSYLNSRMPISLTDTTRIDFSISNIAGSYYPERFRIVFNTLRPLPVSMHLVSANRNSDKKVSISWKSETETAIAHYEIQRSFDGSNYTSIGTSMPMLNNGGTAIYMFKDEQASENINFYRIKALSQNGIVQYSNIVKVAAIEQNSSITVVPNPVVEKEINIVFNNEIGRAHV